MATGLIIGTGVDARAFIPEPTWEEVITPWGGAEVVDTELFGVRVVLVRRHGVGHSIPPHRINYRANIAALKQRGVKQVLVTSAVGSMNPEMAPGDFCLPHDFIDWTKARPFTFYDGDDGRVVHTDMTRPYCDGLRTVLRKAAESQGVSVHEWACYACLEGPRYETPAEIRALRILGADIVGMTNATEALLCREAGLCFGTLALVTNWAAGISPERLDHEKVTQEVHEKKEKLIKVLRQGLELLHSEPISCNCGSSEA